MCKGHSKLARRDKMRTNEYIHAYMFLNCMYLRIFIGVVLENIQTYNACILTRQHACGMQLL